MCLTNQPKRGKGGDVIGGKGGKKRGQEVLSHSHKARRKGGERGLGDTLYPIGQGGKESWGERTEKTYEARIIRLGETAATSSNASAQPGKIQKEGERDVGVIPYFAGS